MSPLERVPALQMLYSDRPEALAEMLFKSYNDAGDHPWRTYDGKAVPRWEDLGPDVQAKWTAAAVCVLRVR